MSTFPSGWNVAVCCGVAHDPGCVMCAFGPETLPATSLDQSAGRKNGLAKKWFGVFRAGLEARAQATPIARTLYARQSPWNATDSRRSTHGCNTPARFRDRELNPGLLRDRQKY